MVYAIIEAADKQGGTELGTLRRIPKVAGQVSLLFAGDLMDAADSHRRVVHRTDQREQRFAVCPHQDRVRKAADSEPDLAPTRSSKTIS